jgi:hypothetical protein
LSIAKCGDQYSSISSQKQSVDNVFVLNNNEISLSDISEDNDSSYRKKINEKLLKIEKKKSKFFISRY